MAKPEGQEWPRITLCGHRLTIPEDGREWMSAHLWLKRHTGKGLPQLIHELGGPAPKPPLLRRGRGGNLPDWTLEGLTTQVSAYISEHGRSPNTSSGRFWLSAQRWLKPHGLSLREVGEMLQKGGSVPRCSCGGPTRVENVACRKCYVVVARKQRILASRMPFSSGPTVLRMCSHCKVAPKTHRSTYCAQCRSKYYKAWKSGRWERPGEAA
jgi:hypothetical protein